MPKPETHTAKRKAALLIKIIQDKTTVADASRPFDLTPSVVEEWVDETRHGWRMRYGPSRWKSASSTRSRSMISRKPMVMPCWSCAPENCPSVEQGRQVVESVLQGLADDGIQVSVSKLCRFESLAHASRVIADWIWFYNYQRPDRLWG
jgi:hypothetical protein